MWKHLNIKKFNLNKEKIKATDYIEIPQNKTQNIIEKMKL